MRALSDINLTVERAISTESSVCRELEKYTGTMLKFLEKTDRRSGYDRGSGIREH